MIEKVALIFVGWSLGLLGPIIVDTIKKRNKKKNIRTAIISELKEIQYRLACNVYSLNRRVGTIDKQFLAWVSKIFKSYNGVYSNLSSLEALKRQLKLTDDQLANLGEIMKPIKGQSLTLRKFATPLIDSQIGNLSMFSPNFQLKIFEIKSQLGLLNDRIEDSKFYFRMTFESNTNREQMGTSLNISITIQADRTHFYAECFHPVEQHIRHPQVSFSI